MAISRPRAPGAPQDAIRVFRVNFVVELHGLDRELRTGNRFAAIGLFGMIADSAFFVGDQVLFLSRVGICWPCWTNSSTLGDGIAWELLLLRRALARPGS